MEADPYVFEVTDRLRHVIEVARGSHSATVWLGELPGTVNEYASQWNLTLTGIPDSGAMSCCVFAELPDGQDVVLKIPFDRQTGLQESTLLDRWSNHGGAPRVYQVDDSTGVFLMERIMPGTIMEPAPTTDAVSSIVILMERLHSVDVETLPMLPSVSQIVEMRLDWADERFRITNNAAGAELTASARFLAEELLSASAQTVLLHGDLQPKNILTSRASGLQVIDPLACVGAPVTDAALWAVIQDNSTSIDDRIRQLISLGGFDADELRAWTTVFAVVELRPYSLKYSTRMARYLESGQFCSRLLPESGVPIPVLTQAAMQITTNV